MVAGGHGVQMRVDGRDCINFCSNDYLGLAAHPRVARAAQKALEQGTGSGASALVSGYNREHAALEEELAAYTGRARALIFSSGWAANLGTLRGLLGKGDVLIADELNHASLIDGGRLSGARYVRVRHADLGAFERALTPPHPNPPPQAGEGTTTLEGTSGLTLIATDSVFSMDGDLAPLSALAALAVKYDAALMVDDAHGFGVLGEGQGACAAVGVAPDITMAGFGKALGTAGAFIAGSEELVETLIHRARSFVFSTAPPPAIAAATRASLAIVASAEGEGLRRRLAANIAHFQAACTERGIAVGAPTSNGIVATTQAIQPLVLGSAALALAVSRELLEQGFLVAAIRPPTVPAGTSRLRITLSASHTAEQVSGLVNALAAVLASAAAKPPA